MILSIWRPYKVKRSNECTTSARREWLFCSSSCASSSSVTTAVDEAVEQRVMETNERIAVMETEMKEKDQQITLLKDEMQQMKEVNNEMKEMKNAMQQ